MILCLRRKGRPPSLSISISGGFGERRSKASSADEHFVTEMGPKINNLRARRLLVRGEHVGGLAPGMGGGVIIYFQWLAGAVRWPAN